LLAGGLLMGVLWSASVTGAGKAGKAGRSGGGKNPAPADAPRTTIEGYTVVVAAVRKPTGHLTPKFDMSRAAMKAGAAAFGGKLNPNDPDSFKKFADEFAPGIAQGKQPAHHAGGGEAPKPNLAIDLVFEAPHDERARSEICEVSSNGSAIDEKDKAIESAKIGIYATWRMTDDPGDDNRGTT